MVRRESIPVDAASTARVTRGKDAGGEIISGWDWGKASGVIPTCVRAAERWVLPQRGPYLLAIKERVAHELALPD